MSHRVPDPDVQSIYSIQSVYSLQELEPSPVDEEPYDNEKGYFEPEPEPEPEPTPPSLKAVARATALGLSGRGPVFYLTRIQKYSSYVFTAYTVAHLTNTSILPLVTKSIPESDTYLLLTRPYYQDFPLEPLLIVLPLAAHIGSGLALRLYRRRQFVHRYAGERASLQERRSVPWPKVSGTSALGYATMWLVAGHAFVNRLIPLYVEGSSAGVGLEYVSHGFAKHPFLSFTGFTALVGVSVWHSVWGWAKWLRLNPASVTEAGIGGQLRRKRRWYGVNAVAAVIAGLWLAGGLGVVGRGGEAKGWIGKQYDELFRSIPFVGQYL